MHSEQICHTCWAFLGGKCWTAVSSDYLNKLELQVTICSDEHHMLKRHSLAQIKHNIYYLPEFAAPASQTEESAWGTPKQKLEDPTVHIV